jgi:hypothetical protein
LNSSRSLRENIALSGYRNWEGERKGEKEREREREREKEVELKMIEGRAKR